MRRRHGAVLAVALAGVSVPLSACPLPATALQQGDVQLVWDVVDGPISVGHHFALSLQLCPADARLVRVDATMPEHRHGMNYRPSVHALGDGRWRAEGLMFHMPGRWELRFDVAQGSRAVSLRAEHVLP